MNHNDPTGHSSTIERQLRRLVEAGAEPSAHAAGQCLDVIHTPDRDLLWGGQA